MTSTRLVEVRFSRVLKLTLLFRNALRLLLAVWKQARLRAEQVTLVCISSLIHSHTSTVALTSKGEVLSWGTYRELSGIRRKRKCAKSSACWFVLTRIVQVTVCLLQEKLQGHVVTDIASGEHADL